MCLQLFDLQVGDGEGGTFLSALGTHVTACTVLKNSVRKPGHGYVQVRSRFGVCETNEGMRLAAHIPGGRGREDEGRR